MNTSRCQKFTLDSFQKGLIQKITGWYHLLELTSTSLLIRKLLSCLCCWQMKQDIVDGSFHRWLSVVDTILWSIDSNFDKKIYYFVNMKSSTITQCDHLNWFSQKRKWIYDFLLSTTSFAKISYPDDCSHKLVCRRLGKKWHRFSYLITVLNHCDFHFKHLNISFDSENKLIVYLNSSCQDCSIQKNRKVAWFFTNWYGRISHQWKKVVGDKTSTNLHFVSFVNSL